MPKAATPRKKASGVRKPPGPVRKNKRQNPLPAVSFNPDGRPSAYKPEYDEVAYRFALLGYEDDKLAEFLGIHISTMHEWCKKHPTFSAFRARGKEKSNTEVEFALRHRALGYSHETEKVFLGPGGQIVTHTTTQHYPPDAKSAELWLHNRSPDRWKDRREAERPSDLGIKITVTGGLPKETDEDDE